MNYAEFQIKFYLQAKNRVLNWLNGVTPEQARSWFNHVIHEEQTASKAIFGSTEPLIVDVEILKLSAAGPPSDECSEDSDISSFYDTDFSVDSDLELSDEF